MNIHTRHTYLSALCPFGKFCLLLSEKAMITHSSTLAWRIPGTEEPGGLLSVGSHSGLAAAVAADEKQTQKN